jgi:hypothetical protein
VHSAPNSRKEKFNYAYVIENSLLRTRLRHSGKDESDTLYIALATAHAFTAR